MASQAILTETQDKRFVNVAHVHFDELDAMHMLHNARFFIHMERTASAFLRELGGRWERNVADNPDQFSVVKTQTIDYRVPFLGTGELRVEMASEVERLAALIDRDLSHWHRTASDSD